MYNELIGYEKEHGKVFICDDEMKISQEYNIGELLANFIDLDFSSFSSFYNDIEKIFKVEYPENDTGNETKIITIIPSEMSNFFKKYPLLKKEIINDIIDIRKRIFGHSCDFNFDISIIEPFFDTEMPFTFIDRMKLEEKLEGLTQAMDCELLIDNIRYRLSDVREFKRLTWKFIFEYNNPYIPNLVELIKHPYIQLSNDDDSDYAITEQFFPHILQEQYREAFIFCFDVDFCPSLNELTAEKRLYLYDKLHSSNHIRFQDIKTEFVTQSLSGKLQCDMVYHDLRDKQNWFLDWFKEHIDLKLIQQTKEMPISRFQLYETYQLRNIIAIEFHQAVAQNIKVKRCRNCQKYFVLKGDYATNFCDRVIHGQKYTCKKFAAIQTRKKKIQNNPILKEYEKAYKRNYARLANHKIAKEDFRLWTEEAAQKRDEFSSKYTSTPSEEIVTEFKAYLGNR